MNKAYSLRERVLKKEVVIGLFFKLNSPEAAEIAGNAGFDFIIVDKEHSNFSHYDIANIIRAADCTGMSTVIRTYTADEEEVLHALDSGADGVQIPSITSLQTAEKVCRSAKYYPEGSRGLSAAQRAAMYGAWDKEVSYYDQANENSLVVIHVENLEMAARVKELCRVPQVDVIFVGPGDLSQALGKPGKLDDPEVVALVEGIFKEALAEGKAVGIYCGGPAAVAKYVQLGATYIAYGSDVTALSGALKNIRATAREALR